MTDESSDLFCSSQSQLDRLEILRFDVIQPHGVSRTEICLRRGLDLLLCFVGYRRPGSGGKIVPHDHRNGRIAVVLIKHLHGDAEVNGRMKSDQDISLVVPDRSDLPIAGEKPFGILLPLGSGETEDEIGIFFAEDGFLSLTGSRKRRPKGQQQNEGVGEDFFHCFCKGGRSLQSKGTVLLLPLLTKQLSPLSQKAAFYRPMPCDFSCF